MRILCLHGRRQSASTFAKKIFSDAACDAGKISRKYTGIQAGGHEFVFIDGPYVAQADLPKTAKARQVPCQMYSWWEQANADDGGDAALQKIRDAIEEFGSFDGVLGFSQGGALAASLCRKSSFWHPQVAVFMSAYYFDAFPLPSLIRPIKDETPYEGISSLHVWGEKDQVVPGAKSKLLSEWLRGDAAPFVGGHAAPSPPWADTVLVNWLNTYAQRRAGQKE